MATNSDALYNVLWQVDRKPNLATFSSNGYSNVVSILIPDTVKVSNPEFYFPSDSLLVDRLADEFVAKNGDLLERIKQKNKKIDHGLESVWITTTHITRKHQYMLELTYE
ncbi:hypothetical protein [Pediococcus argentinicus]|uniref:Uncharacterized protein n=1 Tax=Pediococcus argentinicus TaxID=480391 RepID=A0A0R2NGA0_9LACO|nr:hypothetical protein [Pediococcus argentinicus]KRO24847.1 hypothetical protein IV88_GL000676 [Pediococcus argentinicus]NKZ22686.1 hypothetical protein [Pediococcus argentinicus]GEP19673.1 hypothetical protein LSA03_10570 [Pediococcus argentinicus]